MDILDGSRSMISKFQSNGSVQASDKCDPDTKECDPCNAATVRINQDTNDNSRKDLPV